jgi:hypothetical protein
MSSGMWQHAVLAGKYQHFRGTCYPHLPEETLECVSYCDGITLVVAVTVIASDWYVSVTVMASHWYVSVTVMTF